MELDDRDTQAILSRLPDFKLSYETVSYKNSSHYDTALAIPYGKKMICWFSYDENNKNDNVCYCLTMNKNKEYTSCIKMQHHGNFELGYNTILYGTLYQEDENTNKYIWQYLSSANLIKVENIGDKTKITNLELAANNNTLNKAQIFEIYKR